MDPVVRLRAAVCLLDRFPALAGVDLAVDAGEVVLVRGPNGAGKTTLLRALAGLVPIVAGEATVLGVDLRRRPRGVRRQVGLLGHERLGVTGRLLDVPVGRLSAGQRRRVALAAVVARRPALWLLDEPHAGLDAAGRDLLDTLVREAASTGATVVLASHELERARALAGRTVLVAGGQAVPDAPAPEAAGVA